MKLRVIELEGLNEKQINLMLLYRILFFNPVSRISVYSLSLIRLTLCTSRPWSISFFILSFSEPSYVFCTIKD